MSVEQKLEDILLRVIAIQQGLGLGQPPAPPPLPQLDRPPLDWRAVLQECADDLESYINAHYRGMLDHPAMSNRHERDMAPVRAARKLLGQ